MVWRVDDAGKPVELRGFASGTLIRDRVMVTAGHFTAPATALGSLPPSIRIFASFSPTDAKDPKTWIPVVRHSDASIDAALSAAASMRPDRRDPGRPARARDRRRWAGIPRTRAARNHTSALRRARHARPDPKERRRPSWDTAPRRHESRNAPPDTAMWDGKRRIRTSTLRRVVDETWALWSIPSYVCSGDSGGGIFLNPSPTAARRGCTGRQRERWRPRLPPP